MCTRTAGSIFEPPSTETCDRVIVKATALAVEDGVDFDNATPQQIEKYLDDAAELVHPDDSNWDPRDTDPEV